MEQDNNWPLGIPEPGPRAGLDKASIEEFKKLWKVEFDETLTDEQASEIARRVLDLYVLLYIGEDKSEGV